MKTMPKDDLEKCVVFNQNMLRYAEMEYKKEAYLDCLCVIQQIEKSIKKAIAAHHCDFRIYMLQAKAARKKVEALEMAAKAIPKQINYG